MLSAIASIFGFAIQGSLIGGAIRYLRSGIRKVANRVANWLTSYGYPQLADYVRHIARYTVRIGQWVLRSMTYMGYVDQLVDVVTEVDEIDIAGQRIVIEAA